MPRQSCMTDTKYLVWNSFCLGTQVSNSLLYLLFRRVGTLTFHPFLFELHPKYSLTKQKPSFSPYNSTTIPFLLYPILFRFPSILKCLYRQIEYTHLFHFPSHSQCSLRFYWYYWQVIALTYLKSLFYISTTWMPFTWTSAGLLVINITTIVAYVARIIKKCLQFHKFSRWILFPLTLLETMWREVNGWCNMGHFLFLSPWESYSSTRGFKIDRYSRINHHGPNNFYTKQ